MLALLGSLFFAASTPLATAFNALTPLPLPVPMRLPESHSRLTNDLNTVYYFDQLIDHNDPSKGTFKQRFWFNYENYKPGGPIVFFTPGEANAEGFTGYLVNKSINGLIAQQHNGAAVVFEHRFFGLSNPYPDLTVKSFAVHDIQQSINDIEYFAKNVKFPMPGGDKVAPGQAPWVMTGASYSGALTAWTMVNKPDLFQAGWASSAVVQTIPDFWKYFEPIREHMPQNCSADVQAVVAHFDASASNATYFAELKAMFGLQDVEHPDDVTSALKNPIYEWQDLQPATGPNGGFYTFCDALEVKDGVNAPESGWGLDHALQAWGAYFKNGYISTLCKEQDIADCIGTYNADSSFYVNTTVDNFMRSWGWFVCNQVGWFQDTAPDGNPTLVSRLLKPSNVDLRQCQLMFPEAFSNPPSLAPIENTDDTYHGWDLDVPNLFFGNGLRDPWRDATVSAEGVTPAHIPQERIGFHDAFHGSDLVVRNNVDSSVQAVQQQGLKYMSEFLSQWKPSQTKRESQVLGARIKRDV